MGISLRNLVYVHGGGMLQGKEFKAVFTGGPSNTILNNDDLDVALDFESVRERHSSLGTGAMIVISEGTGIVKRVTQYIDFFAHSSCGQCPPCKIGTNQMSRLLQKIDTGQGRRADLDALINLAKMLPGSGRCGLVTGRIYSTGKFTLQVPRRVRTASPGPIRLCKPRHQAPLQDQQNPGSTDQQIDQHTSQRHQPTVSINLAAGNIAAADKQRIAAGGLGRDNGKVVGGQ